MKNKILDIKKLLIKVKSLSKYSVGKFVLFFREMCLSRSRWEICF